MIQLSPFVMVIFGATGDLTGRKLIPALYHLLKQNILPDKFYVVGFARRDLTREQFREMMLEAMVKNLKGEEIDLEVWHKLAENLHYQSGIFENESGYLRLVESLSNFDREIGACVTRFFYLATPPQHYSNILGHLKTSKLSQGCGQGSNKWTRLMIEKPFGKDLVTSEILEKELGAIFEEKQIYRIDHYLAKESLQNILAFRFANSIFEPLWNREHIDHMQLTLAEEGGIGSRGLFYEGIGALRDTMQNHLMAMLAYVTMDEPLSMSAEDVRGKRIEVLSHLESVDPQNVANIAVRGQYGGGIVNGRETVAYKEEKNVDPNSITETFVAIKQYLNSEKWKGVPFYLRTGKRMAKSVVQIDVQFRKPTSKLFNSFQLPEDSNADLISIRIQPKEGISLHFFAKEPSFSYKLKSVDMDFSYQRSFVKNIDDSYEKILLDSMVGDQTLFATGKGFGYTWKMVTGIIEGWKLLGSPDFPNYSPGSFGPVSADKLIERDGRKWILR